MRPIIDPRLGNQRQKGLLQRIAQQAMQRKGYTSALGRFAKLGVGRSPVGTLTGALGSPKSGAKAGPTAQQLGVPASAPAPAPGAGIPSAPSMQALGQAISAQPMPDLSGHSFDNPAPGLSPADTQLLKLLQEQGMTINAKGEIVPITPAQAYQQGMSYANSPQAQNAVQGFDLSGLSPDGLTYTASGAVAPQIAPQAAPAAPIATPGGLVPLGGGMYWDPVKEIVRGGGGAQTAF